MTIASLPRVEPDQTGVTVIWAIPRSGHPYSQNPASLSHITLAIWVRA